MSKHNMTFIQPWGLFYMQPIVSSNSLNVKNIHHGELNFKLLSSFLVIEYKGHKPLTDPQGPRLKDMIKARKDWLVSLFTSSSSAKLWTRRGASKQHSKEQWHEIFLLRLCSMYERNRIWHMKLHLFAWKGSIVLLCSFNNSEGCGILK